MNNELNIPLVATTSTGTITVTVTGIEYDTTGAATGAVALSGTYTTATSTTPFAVSSNATVAGLTVATVGPPTTVPPGTGNAAITPITLTGPAGLTTTALIPSGNDVCLTLSGGATFDQISGPATVTETNGANTSATVGPLTGTATAGVSASVLLSAAPPATTGPTVGFEVVNAGTIAQAQTFQISGLHVDLPVGGTGTLTVGTQAHGGLCSAPTTIAANQSIFNVSATSGAPIFGQTAEATAAAEFQAAEVTPPANASSLPTCKTTNAIIATAADPYDALAASYLEGQLGTGVLITPVSTTGTIDQNTLNALQYSGIQHVYVVGGLLAVTQAEINTLSTTPAYACGGLSKTGANLVVSSGISGQTADDTAVAMDNYLGTSYAGLGGVGTLPSLASAFSSASTYNQTTGNASASAPTGTAKTAIVISDTDWQDADTIAPVAYKYHLPVILTTPAALSTQALSELESLGINQVIVVGGELALTNAVVTSMQGLTTSGGPISVLRIAGQDYTQTAADIAMFEGKVLAWPQTTLYVAQGTSQADGWGDSLAAAPLAANGNGGKGGGILLTVSPTAGEGQYTDAVLKAAGTSPLGLGSGVTSNIQVLGGPLAVSAATQASMKAALG